MPETQDNLRVTGSIGILLRAKDAEYPLSLKEPIGRILRQAGLTREQWLAG